MNDNPSSEHDVSFEERMRSAGFKVEMNRITSVHPIENLDLSGQELVLGTGRVRFDHLKMKNVSYAKSVAKSGVLMNGVNAEQCIFDKSKWWNATIRGGRFVNCSFVECHLYLGVFSHRVEFINCIFDGFSTRADSSLFADAKFVDCSFDGITLNRTTIDGCYFENCRFSGKLVDCVLKGARHARGRRLFGIFGTAKTNRFRSCLFEGDFLNEVNVEDGVVFD